MNSKDKVIGSGNWTEQNSQEFIDFGDFFVPYRQHQMDVFCQLLEACSSLRKVIDLCCGAGYLSKSILQSFPEVYVEGYDLSETMLTEATERLSEYASRFATQKFDLARQDWRKHLPSTDAFVSSLAIHHLDAVEKQQLFKDIYAALNPGGVFLIADIVQPTTKIGYQLAARHWEQWVKESAEAAGKPQAYREFVEEQWNYFEYPDADSIDQPSGLHEQLNWLKASGFIHVDVFWMYAGHAIFGGWKAN